MFAGLTEQQTPCTNVIVVATLTSFTVKQHDVLKCQLLLYFFPNKIQFVLIRRSVLVLGDDANASTQRACYIRYSLYSDSCVSTLVRAASAVKVSPENSKVLIIIMLAIAIDIDVVF